MRVNSRSASLFFAKSAMVPNAGAASGGLPQVAVMQTAEQRQLDHLSVLRWLHRP